MSAYDGNSATILARLDPLSLAVRPPRLEVGEYHSAWSFSPSGSQVALGTGGQGLGIRIVDVARMKVVREIQTGIAAEALAWMAPRRLLALLQSGNVVSVNPQTGRVLRRRAFPAGSQCGPQPTTVTGQSWMVLLAPSGRALARLVVVDGQGQMRAVTLPRLRIAGACRRGDVTVDEAAGRALVIGAGALVAEVDLRTLRVSYNRVAGMRSWPSGRRQLAWLADGLLATSIRRGFRSLPAGVSVIDTRTWRARVIDQNAGAMRVIAGKLLVFDGRELSYGRNDRAPSIGLRAYAADGTKLFNVLGDQMVSDLQVFNDYAYARTVTGVDVVDISSGVVVRNATRSRDPVELLDQR